MLLRRAVLDRIAAGEIDLAFRRWARPTVKSGGSLRTALGLLSIQSVDRVAIGEITRDEARRAGLDLDTLFEFLDQKGDGEVYRVRLGPIVPDPRVTLREQANPSSEDLEELVARLGRLDNASKRGPWTRKFLELLAANPNVRAQDLADGLGLDKTVFKNDVRKLKTLGLTISHSPGYEVSPRGQALLRSWEDDQT